jgi:hypothetical protein
LFSSFMAWPWPGAVPTWNTLPAKTPSTLRCAARTAAGPENISEIVLARAPAAPPDTGPSA